MDAPSPYSDRIRVASGSQPIERSGAVSRPSGPLAAETAGWLAVAPLAAGFLTAAAELAPFPPSRLAAWARDWPAAGPLPDDRDCDAAPVPRAGGRCCCLVLPVRAAGLRDAIRASLPRPWR